MSEETRIRIAYSGTQSQFKDLIAEVLFRACKLMNASPLEITKKPDTPFTIQQFRSYHSDGYNISPVNPAEIDSFALTSDVTGDLEAALTSSALSTEWTGNEGANETAYCDDSSHLRWRVNGDTNLFRVYKFYEHSESSPEGISEFTGLILGKEPETSESAYRSFVRKVKVILRQNELSFSVEEMT